MTYARASVVFTLSGFILVAALSTRAQDRIGPGSTVQGDVLRGEGVFLRGRGMYDLYSAEGRRIDAGTEIMIQKWNMEVYDAYRRDRAAHIQYRKNLNKGQEQKALRAMAEKEERLRTHPSDADVVSGEALNALLVDLSDPTISPILLAEDAGPIAWGHLDPFALFRFAPKLGDRNSGTLNNLIALGRLDPSRGWPIYIPEDKVGAERRAYKATHRELLEQCEKNTLTLEAVTKVDAALTALRTKVSTAVPTERNFRGTAVRYVVDMQAATKIFDASTIDFAQEMIRDTHDYNPQTVGELLAFLRKYRLFFASAAGRPEDGDVYRSLFGLLREQKKEKLGLAILSPELEAAKFEGTWYRLTLVREGKPIPPSADPSWRMFLVFDGTRYTIKNRKAVFNSGTWKLDASKTPRVFDLVGVNAKQMPVTWLGIYDWVDDNLRLCISQTQRPGEFTSPSGSGRNIEVWTRTNLEARLPPAASPETRHGRRESQTR